MTEQEWLACKDPDPMLEYIRTRTTARKLQLFAVACCRRAWRLMEERGRASVEVAEQVADGLATEVERQAARLATLVGVDERQPLLFYMLSAAAFAISR